jgi:hypothetical protein
MREYDYQPMDRSLIDLRDRRDQLSIEISLLKCTGQPDPVAISRMQRDLEYMDSRIDTYTKRRRP